MSPDGDPGKKRLARKINDELDRFRPKWEDFEDIRPEEEIAADIKELDEYYTKKGINKQENRVIEELTKITEAKTSNIDKAINLALYVMRSQLFIDGNKRTAIIFANHYLIKHGLGLLYIPENKTEEFKKILVNYYETNKKITVSDFLRQNCLLKI